MRCRKKGRQEYGGRVRRARPSKILCVMPVFTVMTDASAAQRAAPFVLSQVRWGNGLRVDSLNAPSVAERAPLRHSRLNKIVGVTDRI
jgi:hypothetical protein